MNQPHRHHEGPITLELCQQLLKDFSDMAEQLPVDPPATGDNFDWALCRCNWLDQLEYAMHRLHEVVDAINTKQTLRPEYHGKIIDICLSMKDDYEYGRAHNFVDPEYRP